MSEYSYIADLIGDSRKEEETIHESNESRATFSSPENTLFDLQLFGQELYNNSQIKNKNYHEYAENISGYDIAANCIKAVVYKLIKTPIESYADKWLPLAMRSTIGTAIHDFIQTNSKQFTEQEVCLKVPSIRFSGRLDCLIGNETLVEIKSVPYTDYKKILNSQTPRTNDFYQTITYKYILENYLQEIKNPKVQVRRGQKPLLNQYNIKNIQYIYVAHDIIAHDIEDLSQALSIIQKLKSNLNSKYNKFFFTTILTLGLEDKDLEPYIKYVDTKIKHINYYLENNKIPPNNDPYINPKSCFFCHYKKICDYQ